jgi:hypothetical protein
MLSRVLSGLSLVRVTVGYAATLMVVATTLLILGPRVEDAVVSHMSTNVHNLARGHFATLVGSVFVTSSGFIYVWLPGLICLLALAELFWRSRRLILAFGLGHVGATLIVAAGLAAAIRFGWLPISVAHASDVGISYGAVAVLGALTMVIPPRWRPGWIGWWLGVALLAFFAGDDFTNAGHLVALMIGMSLSVRFRVVARWTPLRCVLLAIGAAFGYLMLANELPVVIAPIAGMLGAITAHGAAHYWLSRRVRPAPVFTSDATPSGARTASASSHTRAAARRHVGVEPGWLDGWRDVPGEPGHGTLSHSSSATSAAQR